MPEITCSHGLFTFVLSRTKLLCFPNSFTIHATKAAENGSERASKNIFTEKSIEWEEKLLRGRKKFKILHSWAYDLMKSSSGWKSSSRQFFFSLKFFKSFPRREDCRRDTAGSNFTDDGCYGILRIEPHWSLVRLVEVIVGDLPKA